MSRRAAALVITFLSSGALFAENKLWYAQPAKTWVEALPIGNGRLGGMIFGGVETEHVQLNEDTIWAGEKRDRINPKGAASLTESAQAPDGRQRQGSRGAC